MSDINKSLELVVKVLVAAIGGILGLFVLGWVMRGLGGLFLGIAGLLIALLKFIVPVAVIAGIVYFAVSQLRPKSAESSESRRSSNTVMATVDVDLKHDHVEPIQVEPVQVEPVQVEPVQVEPVQPVQPEVSSTKQTKTATITVEINAPQIDTTKKD